MHRVLYFLSFLAISSAQATPVSYNRDIRPILSENCFFCHGFDKNTREADLRLDTFEGAIQDKAIVPGKPEQSLLIDRIFTKDEADQMPPHDSVYRLSEKEKHTLVEWIKQGAEYEEHWAYKKLTRPEVPKLSSHPIDAFLKRTWLEHKVDPVKKADPRALLRRLSFDLRGLPPTADEVAAFQKNPSEDNYHQFVDKWLSSLEYAEHQGLLWLDLVRYADSTGMVSDEPLLSAPYRKYVIESFHDDLPFDTFTREQLAGDLLPTPTNRSLIASGYNRLVKTNCEAGVIEKEALYALKGEHVRALGTVWLGATTGCAECHDHKYDPISAKDYYSMAAFFDDLIEAGVYEPGDRRVPLHYIHPDETSIKQELDHVAQIDQVREDLYKSKIDPTALAEWSKGVIAKEKEIKKQKGQTDWVWFPAKLGAAHLTQGSYTETPDGRIVKATPDKLTRHFSGETLISRHHAKNTIFTHVTIDPEDQPAVIALQTINGAYHRVGWHREYHRTYYWGEKDHPTLKENHPWIDPKKLVHMGPLPEAGKTVRLEVPKDKLKSAAYAPNGMGWIQSGGTVTWGDSGYRVNKIQHYTNQLAESAFRYFWEFPLNRDDRSKFPNLLLSSLKMAPEKRRKIHTDIIEIAFRESQHPALVAKLTELYRKAYLFRQTAASTVVSKVGLQKKTHVLNRGNFMDESGPVAEPAIPEAFAKNTTDKRLTRLDLANWIISKDNPMTARVFVNRIWHQFYGRGISETLEDSGSQGDWPSHVDLLDWLAAEFVDSGWSVKHMIRLHVTSDAYKLTSVPGSLLAQSDPTNRLHARQGRHRHSAEEIRDAALAAAGLLKKTTKIPIESFFPYQPKPYWAKSNKIMYGSRYQIWDTNPGNDQYQRSLYTYWKRQNIHPAMLALDAPTRQECTARRIITNTPAQTLNLSKLPAFSPPDSSQSRPQKNESNASSFSSFSDFQARKNSPPFATITNSWKHASAKNRMRQKNFSQSVNTPKAITTLPNTQRGLPPHVSFSTFTNSSPVPKSCHVSYIKQNPTRFLRPLIHCSCRNGIFKLAHPGRIRRKLPALSPRAQSQARDLPLHGRRSLPV